MDRRRVPCTCLGSPELSTDVETRVLVINTGGTIGMVLHDGVLSPEPNALVKTLRKLPILHDKKYAEKTKLYECYKPEDKTLVLPKSKLDKRVVYTFLEYSPLLDSSNMTPNDWTTIGKDIEKYYQEYDGFVVLHGTDTMAYTASALSFMCENLGKPVILTGSQVPIFETRNDGRDNLVGALLIAGQFNIPEVCLYFHHKLYRGNRVTKVDSGSFKAFASPNLPPLANSEVDININWDTVWRPSTISKFTVYTEMNHNVGLLRLFPGITADTVKAFLKAPMEGVILETYGSGNAPDNRPDLLDEIHKATKRGLIMVNCTQCLRGTVTISYATGQALSKAGVVAGFDMTPEAALSKLSYVLAKQDLSLEEKKEMMSRNLRGEMMADVQGAKLSLSDSRFIEIIARTLSIGCKEELEALRDALTPTLACAAAKNGDIEALEAIRDMGTDLNKANYDGRTPLHIAACEGQVNVVEYLLGKGVSIYAKDRFGDTPLRNAILLSLATSGDLEGLKIWKLAGVDMATSGYDEKTPVEVVEGCSSGESSLSLELSPRKRLSAEEERCASRPPPEGAGAVSVSESDRDETKPDLCKQCQMTIAELRRQALALSDPASFKVSE
ncbi:60 kDa lysophospholipase-like isoform X4 [Labeo rohita]|uniref:asparaginase n=1 Tax=Labeo rohita TaxID=84645 RepID=A0A498LWT1_LABRO|nr:60 kDa lysophospholipase-like isoform X4 [Labeo rohita]RXN11304.1 60 kDa lysophospholipase-like isoform X4 [Labeo rohita]